MMAAYEQNDARDSARLLASMTLEGLDHPERAPELKNAINNMYRLLKGYGTHQFYGCVDHEARDDQFSTLLATSDRNVGELKTAFEDTFSAIFENKDPNDAIDAMKGILQLVVCEPAGHPDPEKLEKTREFFIYFVNRLEARR